MSIGLYILVIGVISFIGGMSQVIPEIFILIGLFAMGAGIVISEINVTRLEERIDKLEDKIKALEERRKEDGEIH